MRRRAKLSDLSATELAAHIEDAEGELAKAKRILELRTVAEPKKTRKPRTQPLRMNEPPRTLLEEARDAS